jgi:hypothetical protein
MGGSEMERIKLKIDEHEGVELKTELKNVCESLKNITSIMKCFIGI